MVYVLEQRQNDITLIKLEFKNVLRSCHNLSKENLNCTKSLQKNFNPKYMLTNGPKLIFPLHHSFRINWVDARQCSGYADDLYWVFDNLSFTFWQNTLIGSKMVHYALDKDLELHCPVGQPLATCHDCTRDMWPVYTIRSKCKIHNGFQRLITEKEYNISY